METGPHKIGRVHEKVVYHEYVDAKFKSTEGQTAR